MFANFREIDVVVAAMSEVNENHVRLQCQQIKAFAVVIQKRKRISYSKNFLVESDLVDLIY